MRLTNRGIVVVVTATVLTVGWVVSAPSEMGPAGPVGASQPLRTAVCLEDMACFDSRLMGNGREVVPVRPEPGCETDTVGSDGSVTLPADCFRSVVE